ncbi:hypothetical protein [Yoonia sp. 208BN28-4]
MTHAIELFRFTRKPPFQTEAPRPPKDERLTRAEVSALFARELGYCRAG